MKVKAPSDRAVIIAVMVISLLNTVVLINLIIR
jgi:hypothetical protein